MTPLQTAAQEALSALESGELLCEVTAASMLLVALVDEQAQAGAIHGFKASRSENGDVFLEPTSLRQPRTAQEFKFGMEVLNWNRAQQDPPIDVGRELWVADEVLKLQAFNEQSAPPPAGDTDDLTIAYMAGYAKGVEASKAQQVAVPAEDGWYGHKFKEVRRGIWRCDCGRQLTDGENKCTNGTQNTLQSQPPTADAEDTQTHADTYPEREAHALSTPEVASHEAQQVAVPAGWALVPIEPTQEMIAAGSHVNSEWLNGHEIIDKKRNDWLTQGVYKAMLAAVQGAKPVAQQVAVPETFVELPVAFGEIQYQRPSGQWGRIEGYTRNQMREAVAAAVAKAEAKHAQQVAVPATDEHLCAMADRCTPNTETGSLNYLRYARAIEAHHGITQGDGDARKVD